MKTLDGSKYSLFICTLQFGLYMYICLFVDRCVLPLGMEGGWIPDSDITASSYLDVHHTPQNARLYGPSSWIPDPDDENPMIKVAYYENAGDFSL